MATPLPEQVAGLLIPMVGRPMILPNVAVAEIVPWKRPTRKDNAAPPWLLGRIEWRGLQVPLISLELMNNVELDDAQQGSRIAVVNGVGKTKLPFYAISIQGIPRLLRVYQDDITQEEQLPDKPALAWQMAVNGERMVVPNLDYVEEQLEKLGAA